MSSVPAREQQVPPAPPPPKRYLANPPANENLSEHAVLGVELKLGANTVIEARRSTGLSQAEFASALGISKRTLQEWEQGRRAPSGAAQALIRIARKHPAIVRDALTQSDHI